jgi:TetR/AcrR family transcriptional repressor of uid operon
LTVSLSVEPLAEVATPRAEPEVTERRRYDSPVMADRRRRILAEAQAIIDELGVEGFTIRELSRRAGVAQRTLYNQFGSKEDILASAIHDHFAGLLAALPPPPPASDFEGHLRRIDALVDRTVELKRYATAMVGVFFSPTVDRRLYETLRWISGGGSAAWVPGAMRAGVLTKLSPEDVERLSTLLINTGYANITDWAAGRISADEMKLRFKINFLTCLQPATRAPHQRTIARLVQRLRRKES